jgi:hypothetical protein
VSKVYLALKDLGALAFSTEPAASAAAPFGVRSPPTLTIREASWPSTSSSTSSRRGRKRLSMYSLAKVLGTAISNPSS